MASTRQLTTQDQSPLLNYLQDGSGVFRSRHWSHISQHLTSCTHYLLTELGKGLHFSIGEIAREANEGSAKQYFRQQQQAVT